MEYSYAVPGSLPFSSTNKRNVQQHFSSRSNSQASSDSGRSKIGMAIPGARVDIAPPALPPPRYNDDLDGGYDLAWKWQNHDHSNQQSSLAPIKPGSSLWGGNSLVQSPKDEDGDVVMEMDVDASHFVRPITQLASRLPFASRISLPSLITKAPSPPSLPGINQGLPGENPLAQQNHDQSTKTYDQHLLLKIGKSQSPPRNSHYSCADGAGSFRKTSFSTKEPGVLCPSARGTTSSDSVTKCVTSPRIAASSDPNAGWYEPRMDARSPTSEGPSQPFTLDSLLSTSSDLSTIKPGSSRETTQTSHNAEGRIASSSHESAHHQNEIDLSSGEVDLRNLRRYDRPVAAVVHGTKRRALSPLPMVEHDQTQEQGRPSTNEVGSPGNVLGSQNFQIPSLSSTVSSIQQNSFASTHLTSPSSGSMTSLSSLSYGPSSASDYIQTRPFLSGSQVQEEPVSACTDLQSSLNQDQITQSSISTPISEGSTLTSRIGNHYLCSCCPKKPRRFETEERLRAHENEKQYNCRYCSNRFKNKNEAERHQNSLHVRRQSWSCSAMSTYQAAFHASELFNPRNLTTDTCGFCGQEFNKHPPNWEERIDHLTSLHKFGECNTGKKFFRADHFRQHLKHSHAGRSGKWTNILENSCLREEAASEPASLSPTASEHSQSGSTSRLQPGLSNPTDASGNAQQVSNEAEGEQ